MSKIIIVSNRLPINIQKKNNSYHFLPSAGGLVTALKNVFQADRDLWIGWPGISTNSREEKEHIQQNLGEKNMHPVFLSHGTFQKFYAGFSNATLWPLFHYFPKLVDINDQYWDGYKRANQQFADQVLKFAEDGDLIWIHDYQLFLLPQMIREKLPNASIGFFNHIPFPSYEIFRILPWRSEILKGVLGADLIGFHTFDDVRHFSSAASRILGARHSIGCLETEGRSIKIDTFPISIDYEEFSAAAKKPAVIKKANELIKSAANSRMILSVDRLDISKGIIEKLQAFDNFLEKYPHYREKVTLVVVVVPSRTQVEAYKQLKANIEQEVGRINGKYGLMGWSPILYMYRALNATLLSALYRCSSIAFISPLRDGMNLVAKEYIASRTDGDGVLILSEMAGASKEMLDALIVNPYNRQQMVEALHEAMEMPIEKQFEGNRKMQARLKRYDVHRWSKSFLDKLKELKHNKEEKTYSMMRSSEIKELRNKYNKSAKRLFLLDYDGTLVGFFPTPQQAVPDKALKKIIKALAADKNNHVIIISGRDRHTLQSWFEGLDVGMIAEHGVWNYSPHDGWIVNPAVDDSFKGIFRPMLEDYIDRTPGTFIEEKDYSLVWHYRQADSEFGQLRAREIVSHLSYLATNLPVHIMEGNKVVEIKHTSVNKGVAAGHVLLRNDYDFILAIGDDVTDEDIFGALPADGIGIKVGEGPTRAQYRLKSYVEVRSLLEAFSEGGIYGDNAEILEGAEQLQKG